MGSLLIASAAAPATLTAAAAPAASTSTPAPRPSSAPASPSATAPSTAPRQAPSLLLGIDVLEADGFSLLKGKRVGLLTNQAGVNRRGESTIDVLRRGKGFKLTTLYAAEHGLQGLLNAEAPVGDAQDARTRLPVVSLYRGHLIKPTAAMLRDIDVLVIDLQDIGVRSYTFASAMKIAMEGCFENKKSVVVLDRPNPLGGLKVDGPLMDERWMSDVGRFRVPYVHGLTIGELARMARWQAPPGGLRLTEEQRKDARLTVVPMRGWRRAMTWPETGLAWVPPSGGIKDFEAAIGYAMTGLGCLYSGFTHGIGPHHPFRIVSYRGKNIADLEKALTRLKLPGLRFRRVSAPDHQGKPAAGLYVDIVDYQQWNPTELSLHLMRLGCILSGKNRYRTLSTAEQATFNVHVGSTAWWDALSAAGGKVDVASHLNTFRQQAANFQNASRKFWLYN